LAGVKSASLDRDHFIAAGQAAVKEVSMWQVVKSVLAAFFGVQREQQRREDFEQGNPVAFIVVGILLALVLVGVVAAVAIGVSR
jgi:hypothetical protein